MGEAGWVPCGSRDDAGLICWGWSGNWFWRNAGIASSRYEREEADFLVCLPFDVLRMERSEAVAAAIQGAPSGCNARRWCWPSMKNCRLEEIALLVGGMMWPP